MKTGLYLVYGERYHSFEWALIEAHMCSLEDQRAKMLKNFTKHCLQNSKFKNWFVRSDKENRQGPDTRQKTPTYKPVPFRTSSYGRSAIPQMVTIANTLKQQNSWTEVVLNSGEILVI